MAEFNTVEEFLKMTKGKAMPAAKMPDAPAAHWSGVATIVAVLGVAVNAGSQWVQMAAVAGATCIGTALCWRDAHVRRSRNETEQSRYVGAFEAVLGGAEGESDGEE